MFSHLEGIELDDEHRVTRVRRVLEPDEKRQHRIVQFWAVQGGLRTVRLDEIIDVR